MKKNRVFKVLTTSALVASLAAPIASPAFADSKNIVTSVPSVADNYDSAKTNTPLTWLHIKTDKVVNTAQTFRLVLENGTWSKDFYNTTTGQISTTGDTANYTAPAVSDVKVQSVSDKTLTLELVNPSAVDNGIYIPLFVEADGNGPMSVELQSVDGTLTSGKYTIANASAGKTVAVVEDVKNITSGSTSAVGDIRIDETSIGAIYQPQTSGRQKVTLKLPSNYEFTAGTIQLSGGFSSGVKVYSAKTGGTETYNIADLKVGNDSRTVEFFVEFTGAQPTTRGTIYIKDAKVKVDSSAAYTDDVKLTISGDKVTSQDVTLAKNKDYGAAFNVDEVKNIVAGKYDSDVKTGKIQIKEDVANSFVGGRNFELQLPANVKLYQDLDSNGNVVTNASNANGAIEWDTQSSDIESVTVNSDKNRLTFSVKNGRSSSKIDMKFKLRLAVQADQTGDLEATLKGAGISEQKLVIAKAVAPITAEMNGDNAVKIGVQDQAAPEIVLTEGEKAAFKKTTNGTTNQVVLELPAGVSFAATPNVEVLEGDLEISKDSVKRTGNDRYLVFEVKSESTKPSKIKLSNVKLTVDRNVPEGRVELKVGGSALVDAQNAKVFNTDHAVKLAYAKVITPAPGDTTATNIVFKLNSKTFTVDGKEIQMDAAPLVGWDRAYLPVRFAANALNVADDQIVWDDKTSTFTIFKGDRVITGKVGDKFLTVNGVKVPMDVPVWRNKVQTNDRVMVPIRYLANALNANIEWNKETSEITIEAKK